MTLLISVGCLIGLTTNVMKLAHDAGIPLLNFLFWGILIAGGLLMIIAILRRQAPRLGARHIEYYLFAGLVSLALPNALSYTAVPHVGVSFVALSMAFPPLATYLLALTFGMECYRHQRALGVGCALLGALTLAWSKSHSDPGSLVWVMAALSAPILLAIGNIYRTRRWPPGATSLSLAPGMLLGASLILLFCMAATGTPVGLGVYQRMGQGIGPWLLLGQVLLFSITYLLFFMLQRVAGPVYLSQIGSVAGICGSVIAIVFFDETPATGLAVAAIFILVGIFLVNRVQPTGLGAAK
jgi:drug/metabolite transporter (DMT)-like permease